jgi:transposase
MGESDFSGPFIVGFGLRPFRRGPCQTPQGQLAELRTPEGAELPPNTMERLKRLMGQHSLLTEQLREIEAARQRAVATPDPDRIGRMIQLLVRIVGLGVETATVLAHEVFSRRFRDRRALAGFVGRPARRSTAAARRASRGSARTATHACGGS